MNRNRWGLVRRATAGGLVAALGIGLWPAVGTAGQDAWGEALGIRTGGVVQASILGSDPRAVGIFTEPLAGFPLENKSFVILSTGVAADAYQPDANNAERIGFGSIDDDTSTALLGSLTSQGQDLTQFQITMRVPGWARGFAFDYAFFTEEWPDYYGTPYNDAFVAQVGEGNVVINPDGSIDVPGNLVYDQNGGMVCVNVGFGLDPAHPNPDTGTTYDGTTGILTTSFALPQSSSNTLTITFSIFDVWDSILDSAVFLDNFRFLNEAPSTPTTEPRHPTVAQPVPTFGRITGGGYLTENGTGTFAGNIHAPLHGGYRGNWRYTSLDGTLSLQAASIDTVDFATIPGDDSGVPAALYNTATITGTTREGITFRLTLLDRGEPGTTDEFHIEARDATGSQLLNEGGVILQGNIQIHPPSP